MELICDQTTLAQLVEPSVGRWYVVRAQVVEVDQKEAAAASYLRKENVLWTRTTKDIDVIVV